MLCYETLPPGFVAVVSGVDPPISRIGHCQPASAACTDQHPLQKGEALSGRTTQSTLLVEASISLQSVLVREIVFPANVALVVILDQDLPRVSRDADHAALDVPLARDLLGRATLTVDVGPSVCRVFQDRKQARVLQAIPDQLSCPQPAVGPLRKAQTVDRKVLGDAKGRAVLLEELEDLLDTFADLVIRIEHNPPFLVIAQADRKRKAQLTLAGLVQLATLEARADQV